MEYEFNTLTGQVGKAKSLHQMLKNPWNPCYFAMNCCKRWDTFSLDPKTTAR